MPVRRVRNETARIALHRPRRFRYGAVRIGYDRPAPGTREPPVSTPTTAPPAWLEAAAKLDTLLGDKVSLSAARTASPPTENEDEGEPGSPDREAEGDPRAEEPPPEAKPR